MTGKKNFFLTCWFLLMLTGVGVEPSDIVTWQDYLAKYPLNFVTVWDKIICHIMYLKTVAKVAIHNKKYDRKEVSYKMAINRYTCLDDNKLRSLKSYVPPTSSFLKYTQEMVLPRTIVPDQYDFRTHKCSTPVRNQWYCGSCYAFTSVEVVGIHMCEHLKRKVILSPQQLVDCSRNNSGCSGGNMIKSYMYMSAYGIVEDHYYPYYGYEDYCNHDVVHNHNLFKKHNCSMTVYRIPSRDDYALQCAIAKNGCVAVAISIEDDFLHYKEGCFEPKSCNPNLPDHAVLACGYTKDYWIIKNSWDTDWGVGGYFYLSRKVKNACGVSLIASYTVVKCTIP